MGEGSGVGLCVWLGFFCDILVIGKPLDSQPNTLAMRCLSMSYVRKYPK